MMWGQFFIPGMVEGALLACLLIPFLGFALIGILSRWANAREGATLAICLCLIGAVIFLFAHVADGARPALTILPLIPGIRLNLTAEPLGLLFAALASGLWLINSIFSFAYMRACKEKHQARFYLCFALAIGASMGIALSGNLISFFIFYELLTLSTYPLVTHAGTEEARRGGHVYLGLLLGTSIAFLLTAIVWTWVTSHTLEFTLGGILAGEIDPRFSGLLLLLYAFGIGKAALMPFHRWLPAAMVAPTPVSALLHAVAVVKAGVFGILKVAIYVFGLDFLSTIALRPAVLYVAGFTVIAASLIALMKTDLKARLAYSTIAQLSYVVMGAMLATSAGIVGGALQLVTHGMAKITLFMCAGSVIVATGRTDVSEMSGLGKQMPWTFAAFFIASFSLIGLPPFGGFMSKWELLRAGAEAHEPVMVLVLILSTLLSAAYLLPVCASAFFGPVYEAPPKGKRRTSVISENIVCVIPLCLSAAGCAVLFCLSDAIYNFLKPILP